MTNDFGFCLLHLGNGLQDCTPVEKEEHFLFVYTEKGEDVFSLGTPSFPSTAH